MMNIHHLELFYYVARHGGITEAVRRMPYGIQQPAISGQVLQLESYLGVTLFKRRPFVLTPAGEELFQFIKPFFDNLETMAEKLRGGSTQVVRIGASEIILRDHLPGPLEAVRKRFPRLKVSLVTGYQAELESRLFKDELDLAVTVLESKVPSGLSSLPLAQLGLGLLVEKGSRRRTAEDLWKCDRIEETLICQMPTEAIAKHFQAQLSQRGVDWPPGITVGSLMLVEPYVANGYGIGLVVNVPGTKWTPKVRLLPLADFQPITVGTLWRGKASPVVMALNEELAAHTRRILALAV
jgi:DNA-binding transcriptional LysR family regulator